MIGTKSCYFCGEQCEFERVPSASCDCYTCETCGCYTIPDDFGRNLIEKNKELLAGYLYETKAIKESILQLTTKITEEILNSSKIPKTVMQKVEKLLVNLYKLNKPIGEDYDSMQLKPAMGYAIDSDEIDGMLEIMCDLGWIKTPSNTGHIYDFKFTAKGFDTAERLILTNVDSKKVFIAMQFSDDLLELCRAAIQPACKACGFDAGLVSNNHNNGITDEIIAEIRRSKFVIVDFTYNNAGAYFEAGFAQGLGRPVIRICQKEWFDEENERTNGKALHFDVRHYNTILYENHQHLIDKLKANIRANIPNARLEDEDE